MVNKELVLDDLFHALSDTTRRRILRDLSKGDQIISKLPNPNSISLVAMTKHIAILERAKLVTRTRKGKASILTLNSKKLQIAENWINFYSKFWNQKLDALDTFLEKD